MDVNTTPPYDPTDNPTGCCPRFHPDVWDDQELRFEDKPFVRTSTVSLFHVPLNFGAVFRRACAAIEQAHAERGTFLVLSRDGSPWQAEHLFAVDRDVPGADMVRLSGTFLTRVFEGPSSDTPAWYVALAEQVAESRGRHPHQTYFFYTTCPRCAKVYGKNYVVGVARVD